MSAAIKVLVADEDYMNLLRAEELGTMPKFLAERAKQAAMKNKVHAAFDLDGVTLPLTAIHPIRQVKPTDHAFGKYKAVVSSIREVGVIEPLIVHPQRESRDVYLLLDGHMRLKALQELGRTEAFCL